LSDDPTVKLNFKGLDKLIEAFGDKMPTIKIGVLGDGQARSGGQGPSNAEIGAIHEFGSAGRSFLRVPLMDELSPALERDGIFSKKTMKEVLEKGTIEPLFTTIAIVAEGVVLKGFDTGGYGKWKPSNMDRKKVHQTLVETTQLRDSITSEVVS
jgi:phage gpG-like protein